MSSRRASILIAVVLALAAAPVAAQDDGLAASFPDRVGDVEREVNEESGPEWLASFDPADDLEAAVVARTNALVESLEASVPAPG